MSKVYLLGAGPGDPGLLTVKARDVLSRADVIVYDYLANESFINYRKPGAEVIYVGKMGGDHTLPQDQINALLVAKAKEGKVIARLKGGDPYVFGRGAEEAEELYDAGVECEVVPGVTSAVAAPAYAGIPLTHRRYASSVSFVTGHEDPTKPESAHNWDALASGTSTLVFFMGVKNLSEITGKLIAAGRPAETPAALVRWGTTCRQKSLEGTLATITDLANAAGMKAPALLVVGEVIKARPKLNWFEKKPLLGKGVLITRSREQASDQAVLLEELGACCYQQPTIDIRPLADTAPVQAEIAKLGGYDWVVFTSVNGVKHFFAELESVGLDARAFGLAQVAAIGPSTAATLREYGIRADLVPSKYVAEDIVTALLDKGAAGKKVLIPRAREAREVLPVELAKAGAKVTVLPVYETVPAADGGPKVLELLEKGKLDFITFASSSTVDNFFGMVPPDTFKPFSDKVKLACIGPVTAQTLCKYGFTPDIVPEDYTIPALVNALIAG